MLKSTNNPFSEITGKESNVQFQKSNVSAVTLPASSIDCKPVSGKQGKDDLSGFAAPIAKKDHSSKQSWYETADGFGKAALPQNRGVNSKNRDEKDKENPAMISSRDHANSIIEKIEEDKEWVKVEDPKACSKVSTR